VDTLLVALRVALSLAVVLGLLWYVQRRVTGGPKAKRNASLVTVVGRQGIGQKASVVVVDVEGTRFILGVTEQSVNVLHSDVLQGDGVHSDVPHSGASAALGGNSTSSITALPSSSDAFARILSSATAATGTDTQDAPLEPPLAFRPRRDRTQQSRSGQSRSAQSRPGHSRSGRLGGSILSPATWQQTAAALRQGR
jgi:flagellar protein FliO/FliZ